MGANFVSSNAMKLLLLSLLIFFFSFATLILVSISDYNMLQIWFILFIEIMKIRWPSYFVDDWCFFI